MPTRWGYGWSYPSLPNRWFEDRGPPVAAYSIRPPVTREPRPAIRQAYNNPRPMSSASRRLVPLERVSIWSARFARLVEQKNRVIASNASHDDAISRG